MDGHLMNCSVTIGVAEVIIDSSDQFICDEDFDYSVFWKSDKNYDLPVFGENLDEIETYGSVIEKSGEHNDHCYCIRPIETWSYSLRPDFKKELDELMQMISDHETAYSKNISSTISNHSSTHNTQSSSVKENEAPVEKISPTEKRSIPNVNQVKTRILPALRTKNDSEINFIPSRTYSKMKPAAWAKKSNKVQSPEEAESTDELSIEKPPDFQNIVIPEFEPRVTKSRVSKFKSNLDIIKKNVENIDDNQEISGDVSQESEKKVELRTKNDSEINFIPSRTYSKMKPAAWAKKSNKIQSPEEVESTDKLFIEKPTDFQNIVIPEFELRLRRSRVSKFKSNLDIVKENVENIDDNQEISGDVSQKTKKKVESQNSFSLPILEVEENKRCIKSGDHGSNETHLPNIIQRTKKKLEAKLSTITSISKPENGTFEGKQVNISTVPSRTYSMMIPSAGEEQNSYSLNILEVEENKEYIKSGDKTHLPISINPLPNILETQVPTISSVLKPKNGTFRAKQVSRSTVPAVKTNKGGEVDFIPSRTYSRMKPCAGIRKPKIVQTSERVDSSIEPLIKKPTYIQNEVLPDIEAKVRKSRVSKHEISGEVSRGTREEEKAQNSYPLGISEVEPVKVQSEKGSKVPNFAKSKSDLVTNPVIIEELRESHGNKHSSEKQSGNYRKNERYFEQAKCPRTNLSQENPREQAQYVSKAPPLSKKTQYSSKKTESDYKRKKTLFEERRKSVQANLTERTRDNSKGPLASSSCLSKLETQTEGPSEDSKKLASKERKKKSFPKGSSQENKESSGKLSNPDLVSEKHTKGRVNSHEDKNTDGKRKKVCSENINSAREGIRYKIPKKKECFGKIQKYERERKQNLSDENNSSVTSLSHKNNEGYEKNNEGFEKNNEGFEKNISKEPSGSGLTEVRRSDHYGEGHKKDGKEKIFPFSSKSPHAQKNSLNYSKLSEKDKEKCVSSERKRMRSAEEHKKDRIIEKPHPSRSESPQAQKETLSYSILSDMDIEKFMPNGKNNMDSSERKRNRSAEDRVCIGSEIDKKNVMIMKIFFNRNPRRETVLPDSDRESASSEIDEEGPEDVPPPTKRQKTNGHTKRSS